MAKKFFSVLGTGKYQPCYYELYEKYHTRYVQEAIIYNLIQNDEKCDEVVVFITDDSKKMHWLNEEIKEQRLSEILESKFENLKIKSQKIPSGKNENEIWDIFQIILDNIEENDEIYFDITHSFRSIPMLVMVVLNYAKAAKNIKVNGIYYGAYEAKDKDNPMSSAPIFDLIAFDSILEWAEGVNAFLKYGSSSIIRELSKKQLIGRIKQGDTEARLVNNFIDKLEDFTNNIYTCRGRTFDMKNSNRKSIAKSFEQLDEKLKILIDSNNESLKPLNPLLGKIVDRTKEFSSHDNLMNGIAVVKWSIENNLIQQGYTALDETIKTYLCQKFGLNDCEFDDREKIMTKAMNIVVNKLPENKWNIDDRYFDKVTSIMRELPEDVLSLSQKVRYQRNDINHFGFRVDAADYLRLKRNLEEWFNEFITIIKDKEESDDGEK
jgi:CRISPR-associated Csx2 family protein